MMLRFEIYFSHHRAMETIMLRMFKESIQAWMKTIESTDLCEKKLRNATY